MQEKRREPLRVEAKDAGGQDGGKAATFIFLHGYGDDAEGFVSEYSWFSFFLLRERFCFDVGFAQAD
jgi:predicted esterase